MIHSTEAQAWRRDRLAPDSWRARLPDRVLDALGALLRPAENLTDARLPEDVRAPCREAFREVHDELEHGRGFVVLEAPRRGLDDRRLTLLYWLLGQALGRPAAQNVQGALLYDVRDTGQDVRSGARFSVTSSESSFHTDASFQDEVVDYVGLLCLRTARTGGVNQLVSGRTVYLDLEASFPAALRELRRPFPIDRRGGARPGEPATAFFPVVTSSLSGPVFRYLRYWIEAGCAKAERPLSPEQLEALDILDGVLSDPDSRVEFSLRPGEMLFVNNRWVLHNRTAFEDHSEPERRRHLVRLWLYS
jgi:alpha-ketoglutarate-dependent taurine dioxygenase